jgi:signal transduction histidine kinase
MAGKGERPSRRQTDANLKVERRETDTEFVRRVQAVDGRALWVLKAARERAAAVLRTARELADARASRGEVSHLESDRVTDERSREDEVLRREYFLADEVAADERSERARLLTGLLEQEREDTDQSLLLERTDADLLVARRDEVLGLVSHDLRNELSGMTSSVGRILMYVGDDEAGRKIFRSATNIQRINLRMSRLIGDLLDIVSIDVGKFTVVADEYDVRRAIEDIVESFAAIAGAKGIDLRGRVDEDLVLACFDRYRIQQVLANLLTNALKYTSEGGRVEVCAERRGDDVRFIVEDSGCGIAPGRLQTIFERFSQGDRPDRIGLGLGLFIARRIVEAHGGEIWAESEPGHGTTFRFTLPRAGATSHPG